MSNTKTLHRTQAAASRSLPHQLSLDLQPPERAAPASPPENASRAPADSLPGDRTAELLATDKLGSSLGTAPEFHPDEFGDIALLVPPGEAPEALRDLMAQIASHVRPKNVIDRLFVHDIAKATALTDYLWRGQMDAYACMEDDAAHKLAAAAPAQPPEGNIEIERQVRARSFIANHAVMMKLAHMHSHVRNQRDSSVLALDSRQMMTLKSALAAAGIDD